MPDFPGILAPQPVGECQLSQQSCRTRLFSKEERDQLFNSIDSLLKDALSFGISVIPGLGDIKDWIELTTGKDAITEQDLSGLEKGVTALAAAIPILPAPLLRRLADLLELILEKLKQLGRCLGDKVQGLIKKLEDLISEMRRSPGSSGAGGAANGGSNPAFPELPILKPLNISPLSPAEIARIDQIRQSLKIDALRNIAYAEGYVDGKSIGEILGVSSRQDVPGVPLPKNPVFKTGIDRWDRSSDSEVKVLEKLAGMLTACSQGTIKLVSERKVCKSCEDVIAQFERMFPGVTILISAPQ